MKKSFVINFISTQQIIVFLLIVLGTMTGRTLIAQENNCDCTRIVGSEVGIPNLSTSNITLPKIGGCIKVKGYFLLDVSFPVGSNQFDGVEFQMDSGSQLTVPLNKTVGFANCTLHGCSKMWKGIVMRTKPGFAVFSRLDMQNCTVKDAQYAINPDDGAILNLSQNNFDNNWIGLNFENFDANTTVNNYCAGTGFSPGLCGNTFQVSGPMLPAYDGQTPAPGIHNTTGIRMVKCNKMTIGGSLLETNFFKRLKTGIYVDQSLNTIIRTCKFEGYFPPFLFFDGTKGILVIDSKDNQINNNSFSYLEQGINISQCRGGLAIETNGPFIVAGGAISVNTHFIQVPNTAGDPIDIRIEDNFDINSGLGTCIKATHIHNPGKISISSNIMQVGSGFNGENPTYGIEFSNYNSGSGNVSIIQNQIAMGASNKKTGAILISNNPSKTLVLRNNINSSTNGYTGFGILAANTVKCQMVDNTVDGNTYQGGYSIAEAFRVDMSESSILCCNKPNESYYGVCYLGANSTDFANTEFKNHVNRLFLYQAVTGLQMNTGNDWTYNDPGKQWDALFEGNILQIADSKFEVETSLMPDGYNKVEVVGGSQTDKQNWFTFQGDDPACAYSVHPFSYLLCGFEGYSIQEDIVSKDLWAIDGSYEAQYPTMAWEAKRQLYDKLLRNPSLINYRPGISAFYAAASNGVIGQYRAFQQLLEDLYKTPGIMQAAYDTTLNSYQQKNAALNSIFAAMDSVGTNSAYYSGLEQQYNTILSDAQPVMAQLSIYDSLLKIEYANRINGLLTANQNLPGNEIAQTNERAINAVLLQAYHSHSWEFDPATRQIINGVAGQCPLTGGRSVYTARNLQSFYMQPDWSQDHCMTVGERSDFVENPQNTQIAAHLFPVPATDAITVRFTQPLTDVTRLRILDLRGQVIKTISLPEGLELYSLDLMGFSAGVYFTEFQSNSFGSSVKKFTVIK